MPKDRDQTLMKEYAQARPEFDLYFEDETELQRQLIAHWKRVHRRRRLIGAAATLVMGITASYIANGLWTRWPL
jgi:hypothetical protein